jgi:hypothetical protein
VLLTCTLADPVGAATTFASRGSGFARQVPDYAYRLSVTEYPLARNSSIIRLRLGNCRETPEKALAGPSKYTTSRRRQ